MATRGDIFLALVALEIHTFDSFDYKRRDLYTVLITILVALLAVLLIRWAT